MNYQEAKQLASDWTKGHNLDLGGWRTVMALLLHRNEELCKQLKELQIHVEHVSRENEALSLDLGIKNNDFKLPAQPQLQTIADIIKECTEKKP